MAYRELHSLEFAALALANVYGPRQDPHGEAGVVAIFAERLITGEPVTIFGDGEQTRDFVYVDDVVDAFVRAATKGGGLLCNIGTGRETSVNELFREMATQAGVDPDAGLQAPASGRAAAERPRPEPGRDPAGLEVVDRTGDRGRRRPGFRAPAPGRRRALRRRGLTGGPDEGV